MASKLSEKSGTSVEYWKCLNVAWKMDEKPPSGQLIYNQLKFLNSDAIVARMGFRMMHMKKKESIKIRFPNSDQRKIYRNKNTSSCLDYHNPHQEKEDYFCDYCEDNIVDHACQLYFFTLLFHKFGLRVQQVKWSFTAGDSSEHSMTALECNDHLKVFQMDLNAEQLLAQPLVWPLTIYLQVWVTGINSTYDYLAATDNRLPDQIWSSLVINQQFVDVDLVIAGERIQPAHQVILAARSPVFMAMFKEASFRSLEAADHSSRKQIHIPNTNWDDFQHFLYFIYTGKLRIGCNSALEKLAETYQVKTLLELCEEAKNAPVLWELTCLETLAAENKETKEFINCSSNTSEARNVGEITLVPCDQEDIAVVYTKYDFSAALVPKKWITFKLEDHQLTFSLSMKTQRHGIPDYTFPKTLTCIRQDHLVDISRITCVVTSANNFQCTPIQLMSQEANLAKNVASQANTFSVVRDGVGQQCFQRRTGSITRPIDFHILMTNLVTDFAVQLIDVRYSDDFESLFEKEDEDFTDVKFQLGDQVVSAHRAILSARSPVFAALLLAHPVGEIVKVEGEVETDIFRALLYFIYTGKLRISARNEALKRIANECQIQTLISLCNAASQGPSDYQSLLDHVMFA